MSLKRQLHQALEDFFGKRQYSATRTGGGHVRIISPVIDGPVFVASTPSEYRAIKNIISELRKRRPSA